MPKFQRKFWKPIDCGDYYDIPLNQGKYAKIDKEDLALIENRSWTYSQGYAVCTAPGNWKHQRVISMHRRILDLTDKKIHVDHINHDGLDNRRQNIRVCTHSQNLKNRNLSSNNTSGYHGVYFLKSSGTWYARIIVNGLLIHLGHYAEKEDAIAARMKAEKKFFGEFRNVNLNL